jgi:hypothetical protein
MSYPKYAPSTSQTFSIISCLDSCGLSTNDLISKSIFYVVLQNNRCFV